MQWFDLEQILDEQTDREPQLAFQEDEQNVLKEISSLVEVSEPCQKAQM